MSQKKNLGVYGFYLNIIAVILLGTGLVIFFLISLAQILTLGFLSGFLAETSKKVFKLIYFFMSSGVSLAFVSLPLLISGRVQGKQKKELYRGQGKTIAGIIISGIIIFIFLALKLLRYYS